MSNPPLWGGGAKGGAPGPSGGESRDLSRPDDKKETRHDLGSSAPHEPRRSMPSFRVKARTRHAIDDAQQGLKSLLTPQTSDKYPHIISPSGATRSHRRGRVAGPATPSDADPEHQDRAFHAPRGAHLLEGADPQPGSALSLRPGSLPAPRDPSSRKLTDRTRLSTAVSQATGHMQSARERAMLLIGDEDNGLALGTPGAHASR